ncbi:hypothetical protein HOT81_gp097 [Gordonia phage Fryberger]|uniref:Uncharacterized protein n=2 Tax=Ronaldovirus TaxID=2733205 RepID=A0A6B9L8E1_9CAUD|nr:hypothetical protein HOT81_gp097 [Gordonia phage Fryberger]AXN53562.1 hypothetical protein SEA_FRYBERGER_97 [Gordonia phage Fryberger]QHB38267.1 hypothetical protein SEA_VOLT_101 [Gordonia phage Volt]QTF81931.1 hypothetical protein SEA_GUEY18_102 [Gordonia phage Guey18]
MSVSESACTVLCDNECSVQSTRIHCNLKGCETVQLSTVIWFYSRSLAHVNERSEQTK